MISPPPITRPFDNKDGQPERDWQDWLDQVYRHNKYLGEFTTANRPTNNLSDGSWMMDTTLGHPIWYYSSGWIDATGTSV